MRLSTELKPRRALLVERLRDPPCDGVVVRDPEDECLLPFKQSHGAETTALCSAPPAQGREAPAASSGGAD